MQTNITDSQRATLFELINTYPSPHNGQPMRMKPVSSNKYEIFFDKERGLQSSDISFIFSFVSIGVFVEHVRYVADALGHEVSVVLSLPEIEAMRGEGLLHCATITFTFNTHSANNTKIAAIKFRQTSRKKYSSGIAQEDFARMAASASSKGMQLHELPKDQAQQAIWLNQRAVFDDMFDEPVRQELNHWLRYSQKQKQTLQDGLAYDCMELNGPVMKQIVLHPGFLHAPVIRTLIQKYYIRTMQDLSSVGYMTAPFATAHDAYSVGEVIAKVWMDMSEHGYYLHPFGTIMSNHAAHKDFLQLVGEHDETRKHKYLVFIFRAGRSQVPVRSLRLPYEQHLVMEQA